MAKSKTSAKAAKVKLPPVLFTPAGETDEQRQANLQLVKPSPGFPPAIQLIAESIEKNADIVVLDYTPQQVNIRFQIDYVWHELPPMDRQTGDYMLATLKQLAGLNYRDRRSRQEGEFGVEFMRKRLKMKLVSQGVRTGERVAIYTGLRRPQMETLTELGMPSSMLKRLEGIVAHQDGMFLVTALPGEGYTSAWRGFLNACDRFMRDYYVIEERTRAEEEVINVTPIHYDESKGENPFTPIPKLLLREPNVIAFNEVLSGEMANKMADLSKQNIFVPTRIYGKHCIDGLVRLLALKPDVTKIAEQMRGVMCMRVVRKLCEDCRQAFVPSPTLLQRLGLPQGSVRKMYRAFEYQPGMVDEEGNEIPVCKTCYGIGYRGLTGVFELLEMSDPVRNAMIENPHITNLMAAARSAGHVSIREMGIVLVAKGTTSLEELQRVLQK